MRIRKKLLKAVLTFVMVIAIFAVGLPAASAEVMVTEEWAARYNGPAQGQNRATAIAVDNAGNVYVTGYSYGGDFGVGTSYDYATVAYDSSGNQLWAARYDGPFSGNDNASAMVVDNEGNVYVTGYSQGSGASFDYATVAYDSSGNQLWVARYDGPPGFDDMAYAMAADDAGNIYVTGYSPDLVTGDDYVTVAYDTSGNQLWVARYDSPGDHDGERAYAIALDGAGNVYVTGQSYDFAASSFDYATVAYDSSGNQLWSARYDGPADENSHDEPKAIGIDNAGNVYVTGYSYGGTSYDYATVAYDSLGNQLWVARYDGPASSGDAALAMAIDSAGNVYVTGKSTGGGSYPDYATVAYDSLGNELWVARYDGPVSNTDYARAIALDDTGNVYVTGQIYVSGTNYNNDYATVAYDSLGNQLWVARYDGPASSTDIALAIATDSAGNVYVTGQSSGGGSYPDYATVKYSQQGLNSPPVACAGADQIIECTGPEGAYVMLDGSCSTDPDGDALTYTWSGPFGTETGAAATVTLPLGTHTITLTVDDGKGGTDSDDVVITVEDTTPPVVSCLLDGYGLLSDLYLDDVLFEMTGTDACSGVANVRYILDGYQTVVSGSYAYTNIVAGGGHAILCDAEDNVGNISEVGSLSFLLFEANPVGLESLIDHFAAQGLIDPQAQSSLKGMAENGNYAAFINYVGGQAGKKIDTGIAPVLIDAAQYIMEN